MLHHTQLCGDEAAAVGPVMVRTIISQPRDEEFYLFPSKNKEGMIKNSDGSYDVYFGPKSRKGQEHNWIQTVLGKGWNMLFRLYGPSWSDKTWRPGDLKLVK